MSVASRSVRVCRLVTMGSQERREWLDESAAWIKLYEHAMPHSVEGSWVRRAIEARVIQLANFVIDDLMSEYPADPEDPA